MVSVNLELQEIKEEIMLYENRIALYKDKIRKLEKNYDEHCSDKNKMENVFKLIKFINKKINNKNESFTFESNLNCIKGIAKEGNTLNMEFCNKCNRNAMRIIEDLQKKQNHIKEEIDYYDKECAYFTNEIELLQDKLRLIGD